MVKCSECGYLSLRNIETRNLDEAEQVFREWGKIVGVRRSFPSQIEGTPFHVDDGVTSYIHDGLPICFARSHNLTSSFRELISKDYETDKAIIEIINKEWDCTLFTKWQQGFTPKEHREMMDKKEMLEWQATREDNDRKWRDAQRNDDKRWRRTELIVLGIVSVVIAGCFTLLGSLISR